MLKQILRKMFGVGDTPIKRSWEYTTPQRCRVSDSTHVKAAGLVYWKLLEPTQLPVGTPVTTERVTSTHLVITHVGWK